MGDQLNLFRSQWQKELEQRRAAEKSEPAISFAAPPTREPVATAAAAPPPAAARAVANTTTTAVTTATSSTSTTTSALLTQLIRDLDEDNEFLLDAALPREVVLTIFRYLSLEDLCRCAQVSKTWRLVAMDDQLWRQLLREASLMARFQARLPAVSPRVFLRDALLRQREVRRRWRELHCAFRQFKPTRFQANVALAAATAEHALVAHNDGEVRLVYLRNNTSEDQLLRNRRVGTLAGTVTAVALASASLFAVGTDAGQVHVWCDTLDAPVVSFTVPGPVSCLRVAEPGRVLCAAQNEAHAFDLGVGALIFTVPLVQATCLRWIPGREQHAWAGMGRGALDLRSAVSGATLASLHAADMGECDHLTVSESLVIFAVEDPPLFCGIRVFDAVSGLPLASLVTPQRTSCLGLHRSLLAVGTAFGFHLYDLSSPAAPRKLFSNAQYLVHALDLQSQSLALSATDRDNRTACTVLFDLESQKRLWFLADRRRSTAVILREEHLVTLPVADRRAPPDEFSFDQLLPNMHVNSVNLMDFGARDSTNRQDCPFSSEYNDISGYNPNDILVAPFDDVNPDLFG